MATRMLGHHNEIAPEVDGTLSPYPPKIGAR